MVVLVFSLAINCCYRPLGYLAVFVSFLPTLFTGHICSISSAQVYLEEEGQLKLDTFYAQMSTFYSTIIIVLLAMVTLIQIAATMYYSKKRVWKQKNVIGLYG